MLVYNRMMSIDAEVRNVAAVRKFWDVTLAGDLDAASALLDEQVVVREPRGLPYGGDFCGISEWRGVIQEAGTCVRTAFVAPARFNAVDGESVLMRVRVRFTSRQTGRSTDTDVVELLKVREGRITEIDVYYRDPDAVVDLNR